MIAFSHCLEYLLNPCPRSLRAMGYLREVLKVKSCRDRCWWSWEPHLQRTRAVIRTAMARCRTRRKAIVLGSGLLHDVPLAELAAAFREVVLVDIVPPLAMRRLRRQWANISILAADVTGTVEAVYRVAKVPGAILPCAAPALFCDDPEVDLVVSVNLLSQLPYLPVAFLKRSGVHSAEAIEAFARGLIRAHLNYLQCLPGTVALIADVESLTVNRVGTVIERCSTVHGVDLPWQGQEWIWTLAPLFYIDRRCSYRRRVIGIPDIHV